MSNVLLKLGAESYHPTASLTGNDDATIIRGKNMMLRGEPGKYYFETFGGIKNLRENIPSIILQGTLRFDANKNLVVGTGTEFKDELHIGQFIYSGTEVLVVEQVLDDTHFLCDRPPTTSATGQAGYKMPILFEMDNKRGTMIWGNALKFDLGNIVAVGEGQLRVNGQVLPGQSMVSNRQVKIAIFNPATSHYRVEKFGYHVTPSADDVKIAVVDGGKKNPTLGYYSFRWAWANKETAYGFSNPSDPIKIDSSGNSLAITASNQRFKLNFAHALANKPSNADSVIIYRTFFQTGARSNSISYAEGSWFVADTVQIADFHSGHNVYVDVLDEELGTEVTFDNDPPPDAEWVTTLAGDLVLLSCYGEKTVANPDGTSPGPMIVPQRRGNRDAFPAETATPLSPPDTIIGFAASVGRVFLMTRVGLPFATSTGQSDFPITTRPFWQTGFKGPFGLVFINDTLYAFTSKGITRSIASGDQGADQFAFAAAAEEITRKWYGGHVHAVHDPANELACFIYSAAYKNTEGFWVSEVLPFSMRQQAFMPLITIEKPGRDMVVCGAAKVNGHLQFLAGGRGVPEVIGPGSSTEGSFTSSGSEGSSSGSTEELLAPLEGGILACGGECGIFGPYAHLERGPGCVFATDVVRSGDRSIHLTGNYGGHVVLNHTASPNHAAKYYVKFTEFPKKHVYIVYTGTNDTAIMGLAFDPATNQINTRTAWDGPAGDGFVVQLNKWYRIDLLMRRSIGKVDGTVTEDGNEANTRVLTQRTHWAFGDPTWGGGYDAAANEDLRIGTQGDWPLGFHMYIDDILVSTAIADYPLGQGYCRAFIPNADGSHNITSSSRFKKGAVGAAITNATDDAYQSVNLRPMHEGNGESFLTDFIQSIPPNDPTNYVEVQFGPVDEGPDPVTAPRIVTPLVGGHTPSFPSDYRSLSRVMLVDNHTLARIWQHSDNSNNLYGDPPNDDPALGNPNVEFHVHSVISPPSQPGEVWKVTGDDGNFNKLRARWYVLYQPGTKPAHHEYLDGLLLEAEFEGDEP